MRYTPKALAAALVYIVFISASPAVSAQEPVQAVIRELAGTVEIKQANSEAWEAAAQGQILAWDTTISTGFRSAAVIVLGDSLITLRPLTRISIVELTRTQDNEKVELNLQSGRVRADVKAPEGGQTEFVIRSPNATNSVRGTVFEFDTLELTVLEGTVEFLGIPNGISSTPFLVDAIGFVRLDEYTGRVSSPAEEAAAELRPDPPIKSEPIRVMAERPVLSSTPSSESPSQPSGTDSGSGSSSPGQSRIQPPGLTTRVSSAISPS